tara:strand:- start:221 stop:601 length:381 start_codon:yes stop_codon:yes gene_type:complete
MATLTTIFQLSTAGVARDRVNFTSSKTAIVKNPAIQTATASVLHTGGGTALVTAPSGTTSDKGLYLYIKNTDSNNFLNVYFGGTNALKVGPNEITFFCVHNAQAINTLADTATVKIEYGYWTLDKY